MTCALVTAYRPVRPRATLGDLFRIYATTPREGALMAVPFLAVWLAMELIP